MTKAQFEVIFVVDEISEDDADYLDANFDALISRHGDRNLLTLSVDGVEVTAACRIVVEKIEANTQMKFLQTYLDLVNKSEIAARVGVSAQAVGLWVRGQRALAGPAFPSPFNDVSGGVWLWGDVNRWLRSVGKTHDSLFHPSWLEHGVVDQWLYERRRGIPAIWDSSWSFPGDLSSATKEVQQRVTRRRRKAQPAAGWDDLRTVRVNQRKRNNAVS